MSRLSPSATSCWGNYFRVLGVEPILGRVFLPEENSDKPGAHPVAVIGGRWRGRFGAPRAGPPAPSRFHS